MEQFPLMFSGVFTNSTVKTNNVNVIILAYIPYDVIVKKVTSMNNFSTSVNNFTLIEQRQSRFHIGSTTSKKH